MRLVSTIALGDGALGTVSLFTVPQGQKMHYLGNIPHDKVPVLDAETTDVKQAGEFGSAVGDFKVKSIRARLKTSLATSTLKIAGGFEIFAGSETVKGKNVAKSVAKGALLEIYAAAQPLAFELTRTTAWEVRVTLPTEPALNIARPNPKKPDEKLPFDPKDPVIVLLTLELDVDPA